MSHPALLTDGSDYLFRNTLYLMVLALGRLQECRDGFGRAMGLTGTQFAVLFGVADTQAQEGVTIRALSEHVHLASTHVTTEVRRLVERGLLEKRPNAADGRSVLVTLTRAGEGLVMQAAPTIRAVNDRLFQDVGDEDMVLLRRVLGRIARNGEAARAELHRRVGGRRPTA